MARSVRVGLAEIYEGLKLFVPQDKLNIRKSNSKETEFTEHIMDRGVEFHAANEVRPLQLK